MAQQQEQKLNVDELLVEFERKLDRLRFQYEQYFQGIEKMEPSQLKKDVFRIQHTLEQENLTAAGTRFRFRSLVQRYNSYKSYWARTLRQMEMGTDPRSIARLERELRKKGLAVESLRGAKSAAQIEAAVIRAASAKGGAPGAAGGRTAADAPTASTATAAAGPADRAPAPARTPAAVLPTGMTSAEAETLHKSYAEARRQCGQTGDVDFATLMATLSQRAEAIRARYGASEIRFQVGVRDGKPVLQAIPKK
jgi:hypothetical protein